MLTTTAQPESDFHFALRTEFDRYELGDDDVHIRGWKHGCGTPFPDTPASQRRYDGDCHFDDCEPWL